MKFDITYKGRVMELAQGEVYTLRPDGRFAYASAEYDFVTRVTLTGYTETSISGNVGYQTTSGGYIFLSDGWKEIGTQAIMQYSQSQAQALVNKIIKNNEQIICNNLLCARYAHKLTENQRAQVRELQHRLQARNNALQAGGLTQDVQTSYPAGYAEMSAYLDKLMAGEGVGVAISTIAWIVVAAIVIAATATAAYFAYKSLADESEKDVKFSKDLTRTLTSKLTEEEYQQLLDETKGIVTKARIKQAVGSYGKVLTIAAFVVGGGLLYRWIKNNI